MDIESARQRMDERADGRMDGTRRRNIDVRTTKFELEGDTTWMPLRGGAVQRQMLSLSLSLPRKFFNFEKPRDAIRLIAAWKNETIFSFPFFLLKLLPFEDYFSRTCDNCRDEK